MSSSEGTLIVLLGQTLSVVGEAFEAFVRVFGHRPRFLYIIATKGTEPHAILSKLALLEKFRGQPPTVRIRTFKKDDITSEEDFIEFLRLLRSVYDEIPEEHTRKLVISITGGRKTISIAGYVFGSHMGARVIDTRSSEKIAAEDRATLAQINRRLSESDPEAVFAELKDKIIDVTMRVPDVVYELPRIRIDPSLTDARVAEVLT